MKRALVLISICGVASLAACEYGDVGPPNPVPTGAIEIGTGGGGSGGQGGSAGGPAVAPVVRTVERRNPLGDLLGNLLVDGDFEYAALIEGATPQAGWYAFGNSGRRHVRTETGGICRTGLRCGVLERNVFLYGRGTAANGTGMVASVSAKPPGDDCSVIQAALVRCGSGGSVGSLDPTGGPDKHGWCTYKAHIGPSNGSLCLFVEGDLANGETALIDTAVLLPDNGTAPRQVMKPLSAARSARYRKIARRVRALLPLGVAPKRQLAPE